MSKRLSIITICYNADDLEKTCESVINQSWQDFEWIVVDGGSNEETQKLWDKYKYRIDKFISEPDTGRYNAMNKGIKLAKGEYLNFLNAGDYYFYNDVLRDIFQDKYYNADVLYGHECFIKDNIYEHVIYPMPNSIRKEFFYYSNIRHQAAFVRKEVFTKYGLYNEQNIVVSDYEKWLELYTNNSSFFYLPYIITNFNLNGISNDESSQKLAMDERDMIIEKYFSKDEIQKLKSKYIKSKQVTGDKFSFIENILSFKNSINKKHKIITILGIRIKIKKGSK